MNTKKLKQLVLDLAIHGKLVPQDPNDEPASELLKRIKENVETHGRACKSKKTAMSSEEIDEVPFDVPTGWVWCRLGDIISVKSGDGLKVRDADGGLFPIYGGNGINGYHDSFNVEGQTILIGRVGFYCGSIHKTISKAWVTDNALIVSQSNLIFVDFLYRLLIWLNLGSTSNSTAQPVVSGKGILPLFIPLPPIAEQHRIVAAIEKWFAVIDQLESNEGDLKKSIEQTKKKVLDLAIHGKLVKQDETDEPASELLKRIKDEKTKTAKGKKAVSQDIDLDEVPFEVPKGWVWTTLNSISVDSADGPFGSNLKKEHYTENREVRIVQLSNIGELNWRDENVKYTTFEHLNNIIRSEVTPGDIIIAKMMPAGRAIICPSVEKKYVLSSDAVRFSLSELVYNKYLYYAINSNVFKDQVYENVQGVTRVRTSLVKLREYLVPLPPLSEQKRIVAKVEEVFGELERIGEMLG